MYPELAGMYHEDGTRIKPVEELDALLSDAKIGPELIESLGSGLRFLDPDNRYISVIDGDGCLWGFGCVGADAQVRGGRYAPANRRLDVGVGMSPTRVGRGIGRTFCAAIVAHASRSSLHGSVDLQVTVAAFNTRSLNVWSRLGFAESHRFERADDGEVFIQLIAPNAERKTERGRGDSSQ
jgi:RimJ/RimL family protein N-acetyltransferase